MKQELEFESLFCAENFGEAIPEEFFISIRALDDQIVVDAESVQEILIPSEYTGTITQDDWFTVGIQTKVVVPFQTDYRLNIHLHSHPYLNFGFFIQISPNSWLPQGITFQSLPRGDLSQGVKIQFEFLIARNNGSDNF